jgi:hypothetical protein
MFQLFRLAHVIGMTLFMGSLIAYNVAGSVVTDLQSPDYLVICKFIEAGALSITLWGLVLTVGSGALLIGFGKNAFATSGWLFLKIVISVAIVLLTMFIFVPSVEQTIHFARNGIYGFTPKIANAIYAAKDTQDHVILFNIIASLMVAYLGVSKAHSFSLIKLPDMSKLFKRKSA